MWGFIFRKGWSSLLHYLKCLRETKFCLGMNKAVSDVRRTGLKTVGEVPGEAGSSSGPAAAQCVVSQVPLELLYLHGQN